MNRKQLESLGRALFGRKSDGYGWQTEMARQLSTPVRTIAAWGTQNPVPAPVASLLELLYEARTQVEALSRHREHKG